jgi:L-threonylcarbamoyladenylate synthase
MIKAKTIVLKSPLSAEDVKRAGEAAKACKIVAFPTDTVYGLGSTGLVKAAARKIYQIKGRPSTKPLPILVDSKESALKWVEWTPAAEALAAKFWPGALTLVLKPTQEGRLLTFAEYQTVAIRVPAHEELRAIIAASGVPWCSTSANLSDAPSAKTGADTIAQFDGVVDLIVDGGPAAGGVESTVVDATALPVRVLREGALKSPKIFEAVERS